MFINDRFLVLYNFGQIGDIAAQVADMNQQRQTGIFDIFIFVHNHTASKNALMYSSKVEMIVSA